MSLAACRSVRSGCIRPSSCTEQLFLSSSFLQSVPEEDRKKEKWEQLFRSCSRLKGRTILQPAKFEYLFELLNVLKSMLHVMLWPSPVRNVFLWNISCMTRRTSMSGLSLYTIWKNDAPVEKKTEQNNFLGASVAESCDCCFSLQLSHVSYHIISSVRFRTGRRDVAVLSGMHGFGTAVHENPLRMLLLFRKNAKKEGNSLFSCG